MSKLIIDIPEHIQLACKDMIENTELESMELHRYIIREIAQGIPLEQIETEIKQNILNEPAKNGTNAEMCCYNSGLLTTLEIIEKCTTEE